jgi:hypothetical protein
MCPTRSQTELIQINAARISTGVSEEMTVITGTGIDCWRGAARAKTRPWKALHLLLATILFPLLTHRVGAADEFIKSTMVGDWRGDAQVIVIWCQTNLPVSLDIQTNGMVTGKLGDAVLRKGQLKLYRGWLGRPVGHNHGNVTIF